MLNKFSKKEVEEVIKTGNKVYSDEIHFIFDKDEDLKTSISISKKKIKLAVHRNKVKRSIKQSLINLRTKIKPHRGVFIVRKDISKEKPTEVEKMVELVLSKAKLLK